LSNEPPDFVINNPWREILGQRGKDSGQPTSAGVELSKPPETPVENRQSLSQNRGPTPQPERRRRQREVLSLTCRGLNPEEIAAYFAKQGMLFSTRTIYRDLKAVCRQLDTLDRKSLGYTVGMSFQELKELWREAWISYHNPNRETGFLRVMTLRELRNLHHAKTKLMGLELVAASTEITAVMTPTWSGVRITTSNHIDDVVREGGVEYAASHQPPAGNRD
jgi:hypothetical protein